MPPTEEYTWDRLGSSHGALSKTVAQRRAPAGAPTDCRQDMAHQPSAIRSAFKRLARPSRRCGGLVLICRIIVLHIIYTGDTCMPHEMESTAQQEWHALKTEEV